MDRLHDAALAHVLKQLPLGQRLQSARVNSFWADASVAATTTVKQNKLTQARCKDLAQWLSRRGQNISSLDLTGLKSSNAGAYTTLHLLELLPELKSLRLKYMQPAARVECAGLLLAVKQVGVCVAGCQRTRVCFALRWPHCTCMQLCWACHNHLSCRLCEPHPPAHTLEHTRMQVSQLELTSCFMQPDLNGLTALASLKDLQHLCLSVSTPDTTSRYSKLPDNTLSTLTKLTYLDLLQQHVTDNMMASLSTVTGLKVLKICCEKVTANGLNKHLAPLQTLSQLEMSGLGNIALTTSATPVLMTLTALVKLNLLSECAYLKAELFIAMPQLQSLTIQAAHAGFDRDGGQPNQTAAVLKAVANLPALTELFVHGLDSQQPLFPSMVPVPESARAPEPAAFAAITSSKTLWSLKLRGCRITTEAWQSIFPTQRVRPSLKILHIRGSLMAPYPEILERVVQCCPCIMALRLQGIGLKSQSVNLLEPLVKLTGLNYLQVEGLVTAHLRWLPALTQLHVLVCEEPVISLDNHTLLMGLKHLNKLHVDMSSPVVSQLPCRAVAEQVGC